MSVLAQLAPAKMSAIRSLSFRRAGLPLRRVFPATVSWMCLDRPIGAEIFFLGNEQIFSGGLDISGTVENGGFETVSSGGSASATIVADRQDVYGSVSDETITGIVIAHSGGTMASATVDNQDFISGVASSTTVNSRGDEEVYSGGTAINTTIDGVGIQGINSGGLAISASISGGEQDAGIGGTASASAPYFRQFLPRPFLVVN
jgi:autotransporter passenger strand-loop-strand repeat protein